MRAILFIAALLGGSAGAYAGPPSANHPIIGTWTIIARDRGCTETYQFRPNGTSLITSGAEVSETAFEVGATPAANGFYLFTDKVTRDNGKPDCGGNVMKIGDADTSYLQFDPKNELLIMCQTPSLANCFGPLVRVRAGAH